MNKRSIKKFIHYCHLWMGLITGIIVFLIAISGALYVFKYEIEQYVRADYLTNHSTKSQVIPLDELLSQLTIQDSDFQYAYRVRVPVAKNGNYIFKIKDTNPKAWNFFDEYKVLKTAYVNPHTAEIIKIVNEKEDFFTLVLYFHRTLFLNAAIAHWVMGISVFLFILLMITGIVLWWPKNKRHLKNKIQFKWKKTTRWRRKNYDLHSILGFYVSFLGIIIAFTGLTFTYRWINYIIIFIGTLGTYEKDQPIVLPETQDNHTIEWSKIITTTQNEFADAAAIRVSLDKKERLIGLAVYGDDDGFRKRSKIYYDGNTGRMLQQKRYENIPNIEKLVLSSYDIHTGTILGFPGKMLAFFTSLIIASLPITGFLFWYGRKFKNKKS